MSMDIEGAGAGAGAGARAGAGAHSSENDSLPLGATGLSNILTRMDMSPAKRHKKANDGEGMGENAVLPKTLDWNTAARAESGDDARSDVSACLPAPPRPAFSAASASNSGAIALQGPGAPNTQKCVNYTYIARMS